MVSLPSTINVNVDLTGGAGLMVVRSINDELLAFTALGIKVNAAATRTDITVSGSIQALQLDDQSLVCSSPLGPRPYQAHACTHSFG